MADPRPDARAIKAQILRDQEGAPIQLVLSGDAATGLAFITSDFAREVLPNCDEAKYLIALAEMISSRLLDCTAARSPGSVKSDEPPMALAG